MFAFSTSRTRLSRSLEQTNELIIRMIITITIKIIIIVIIIIIIIIIRRRRRRRRRRKYYDHHHHYYYYYPSFPFLCCSFVVLYTAPPLTHPTPRTAAFRIHDPWKKTREKIFQYFIIHILLNFHHFNTVFIPLLWNHWNNK